MAPGETLKDTCPHRTQCQTSDECDARSGKPDPASSPSSARASIEDAALLTASKRLANLEINLRVLIDETQLASLELGEAKSGLVMAVGHTLSLALDLTRHARKPLP